MPYQENFPVAGEARQRKNFTAISGSSTVGGIVTIGYGTAENKTS